MSEEKSSGLFESFDLASDVYFPNVTDEEYHQAADELDVDDQSRQVKVRKEQGFLRKQLFGRRFTENCAICDKKINVQFLVCAHIKKRSSCSDEEKRNLHNVVPMCKFGCDELFEKSYININDDGYIQSSNYEENDAVSDYVKQLIGKKCSIFNAENKEYFKWHREHKKRFMK